MLLADIAKIVDGTPYGKKTKQIHSIQPPDDATGQDLTFLFDSRQATKAGAVVAKHKIRKKNGIVVTNVKHALYAMLKHLDEKRATWNISARAEISADVHLPKQCAIDPFVVVNKGAVIGQRTCIGAYSYVDRGVVIGRDVTIYPHVTLLAGSMIRDHVTIHSNTVVSKQGFGYIKKKRYHRIPHIGGVLVQPFVEIGGNVTIDRATIGNTIIGQGTKIDNLVHIGHNVHIGKNCIIMGQVGIAGSAHIGNNVTLCGQVGVSDHVKIGDNVTVYAKSAVFKSIPPRKNYSGIPAREHHVVLRALGRLYRKA